jgi:hypothetical protein
MKETIAPLLWKDIFFRKDKKKIPPKRKDFLKKSIYDCQQALNDAYLGLQNTNDPDLIDRYIYEWNAAHMRYRVLLREIRELRERPVSAAAPTPAAAPVPVTLTLPVPATVSVPSATPLPVAVSSSASISSTNRETDISLLNRSFK